MAIAILPGACQGNITHNLTIPHIETHKMMIRIPLRNPCPVGQRKDGQGICRVII